MYYLNIFSVRKVRHMWEPENQRNGVWKFEEWTTEGPIPQSLQAAIEQMQEFSALQDVSYDKTLCFAEWGDAPSVMDLEAMLEERQREEEREAALEDAYTAGLQAGAGRVVL